MRFALCLLLASGAASQAIAEEYVKSYSVTGRATVRVRAEDANVRVTSADASRVEFHVTYNGYELGSTLFIDSAQSGDEVQLTAREKDRISLGYTNRNISIDVRVPRETDLQLETGDGNIDLTALNGRIEVRSGDGDVRARQLSGTIELRTHDGDISAEALQGELRLRTGDGRIEAREIDGKLAASTGDGVIRLAGRFDALDVMTGDGGIDARIAPGSVLSSTWNVRSGDGAVELTVPKDLKADLDASTHDGRIRVDLPVTVQGDIGSRRVRGTLNGGGPALLIRSGDGPIRIHGHGSTAESNSYDVNQSQLRVEKDR